MKLLFRSLATIGAITLLLVAYSAIRSPSGTLLAFQFVGAWWLAPFESDPVDSEEFFPSTISNPERSNVAGVLIGGDYSITIQDEVYANLLGDGHCIVIANLDSNSEADFPPSDRPWNPIKSVNPDLLQFLRDTTPYSKHSQEIDAILDDSDAVFSIQRLGRSGDVLENLCLFIASPNHKALLEWSSDF